MPIVGSAKFGIQKGKEFPELRVSGGGTLRLGEAIGDVDDDAAFSGR